MDVAELARDIAELQAANAKLVDERDRYRKLYQQMLEKARKLELGLLGQKAERLPASDARAFLEPLPKRGPVLAHQREGVAALGGPRNVLRLRMTAGHCTALLMRTPGRSRSTVCSGGCTAHGLPSGPAMGRPIASLARIAKKRSGLFVSVYEPASTRDYSLGAGARRGWSCPR